MPILFFFCLVIFLLDVMMHLELKCCFFCCKNCANSFYSPGSFFFIPYSIFISYCDAFRVEVLFILL